jgi:hypothetical protein
MPTATAKTDWRLGTFSPTKEKRERPSVLSHLAGSLSKDESLVERRAPVREPRVHERPSNWFD